MSVTKESLSSLVHSLPSALTNLEAFSAESRRPSHSENFNIRFTLHQLKSIEFKCITTAIISTMKTTSTSSQASTGVISSFAVTEMTATSCSNSGSYWSVSNHLQLRESLNDTSSQESDNQCLTLPNLSGKRIRERRRNTLPNLPVWEPRHSAPKKTCSLTDFNFIEETQVVNGTLTTILCSTEL